jgi:RHS repeat-associated protein
MATDTYFQGMDGDYQSGGGTSSASLSDGHGDTVTDADQYSGMPFEHTVDNGPGGAVVTDAITIPWSSSATATQSQPAPLPPLKSYLTGVARTRTFTPLVAGGDRESDTANTFDTYGRITSVSSVPDTADASEDTCTTTAYASNTSSWLLDLAAEVKVVSVPCGTSPSLPGDAVSDNLSYYDGATSLGADTPSAGNVTETQQATSYTGTPPTPVYTTESVTSFDEYGRPLTATDADNRPTTTAYTPATGAEPTSVTVTDPMGLATTTTYDPARDLPLTAKNPAGWTTTEQYDGLGRLTAAWTPGHGAGGSAQYTYAYKVNSKTPSVVTSSTLEPSGTAYLPSETLYDSLGRERETQAENADGNTDVTDTIYNADGWKTLTSSPYYVTGAPTATLFAAPSDEVPSQTAYVYDGAGRVVQQVSYSLATESWETDTAYSGNATTVSYKNVTKGEPTGGTPQTTFTDGRGLTSAIYQYHQGAPADPSDPASDYDATSYTYTGARQLATIKDAAGNKWSYTYDLLGNQTSQSDPDSGTGQSSYDPAGQLMWVKDARGDQASYSYDADGRKTAEYDTTGGAAESSGDELASWAYDTLAKGQLTSSTSYYGGSAYTEKVLGYYGTGQPTGTETIIPSAEGALAGTYIQEDAYNAVTSQPTSYTDSAAGGLPQEKYGYGYDNAGDPTSLTGTWSYVGALSYTQLGQPQEYKMNSSSEPVYMVDSYDEQTNLLSEQETQTGTSPITVDDQHYQYDNVGNVLTEADTPASGATQVQCFQYDYLGRLGQAWSQGSTGCSSGPAQSAEAGAAAPYWEQYHYNTVGDLTSEVSTPASGAATTTTDTYPPTGSAQPHAVSSQQVSGPSGTSTTGYTYNPDGDLTATAASATPGESLFWDDAGRLSSVTSSAGTTSYLYDADGKLLIEQDPGQHTLFLDDEELVLNTSTSKVTGTRFYSLNGQLAATRTGTSTVDLMVPDREGTSQLAIDSQTLAVTQRFYDPYGNVIGTPPPTWPGEQGFVGGTTDPATGLTNLNAREYQPGTGSFISPDPLLNPSEPQDLNSYAYAGDNPSTDSDPSGQCMASWCPPPPARGSNPHPSPYGPGTSNGDACQDWLPGCPGFTGGGAGQGGETLIGPGYGTSPVPVSSRSASNSSARTARTVYHAPPPRPAARHVGCGLRGMGCMANEMRNASAGSWRQNLEIAGVFGLTIVNLLQAGADPVTDGLEGADIGALAADGADEAAEDADAAATCGGESFTAGTKVLLASGAAVPIAKLKPGDKVLATNTRTGKTQAVPLSQVLVHHDTDLYNLTVTTVGRASVIHTTSGHLFWDQTRHEWVKAAALRPGDRLRASSGRPTVVSGTTPLVQTGWMWDLTVPGDHDFYIQTAAAAVLVHNCGYQPAGEARYYSREEVAQLVYQHIGEGDIPGRPTLEEIETTLERGEPQRLPGQSAIKVEYRGVRVIVNESTPTRSTAYYPGG